MMDRDKRWCSLEATRQTYWSALMEITAERATQGRVNEAWDAMQRRLAKRYWRRWREACDGLRALDQHEWRNAA